MSTSLPTLPKALAQRRLAVLWLVMAALPTVLLGINTARFPDPTAIWQWYSPYIFPTLLLIIGALRTGEATDEPAVSSVFYFRLCWGLSLFYGLCLLGTLVVAVGSLGVGNEDGSDEASAGSPLNMLKSMGLLLTAVQGLVSLTLGGFFVATPSKATLTPTADKPR